MISTCEKAKNLEAAREYFEEMKGAGVEPNVITYPAACGKPATVPAQQCSRKEVEHKTRPIFNEGYDEDMGEIEFTTRSSSDRALNWRRS